MEDYVVRATAADGAVRAFAAVTTNMVKEATEVHHLSPVASAALGRTLTGAAMMSRLLKGDKGTMTIQVKGDGPLGGIVAVTDSKSNVRGYVYNPEVDIPLNEIGKLDVSKAVGKGYLNIIKDLGLKEPYVGYVRLISGEIAEDIAFYFYYSEQVPTVIALGVLVNPDGSIACSGGYFIQLMPEAPDDIISYLENKVSGMPSVTQLLSDGKTPEDILELLLGEKGIKINEKTQCIYKCNCSRERMERNLISLGKKELKEIISDQGEAETHCHFCNSRYVFSKEELQELLDAATLE